MTQFFQTSDGLRLAYFVDDFTPPWRKPPTLVMLHSAMGHSGRFFPMVPPFLRDYRVVRMDLRGHGQSDVPPEDPPLTMDRLVQDVAELMAHMSLESAHFLGNSAGGYIAQQLAMTQPERVRSLMLYGSTPGLKHSNALNWLPRIAREGLREFLADTISDRFDTGTADPGLVEWFLDEAAKNDVPFIGRFIGYMATLDWGEELHRIQCPTLVVMPGDETVGGVEAYEPMRRNIPDVTMFVLDGMPHNICDAGPERCSQIAGVFLKARFPEDGRA